MTDLDKLFSTIPPSPDDEAPPVQNRGATGAADRENDGDEWNPPWEEQAALATSPGERPGGSAASAESVDRDGGDSDKQSPEEWLRSLNIEGEVPTTTSVASEDAAPATSPGQRSAGSAASAESTDRDSAAGAGPDTDGPVAISQREVSFVGFDPDAGSAGVPDDNAVSLDDVPPGESDTEDDPYAFLDEDEEALQQAEARIKRRRTLTRVAALGGLLLLGVVGAGLVIRGLVLRLPAVLGRDEPAIATVVPADAGALRTPEDNKPAPTPTFEVLEEAVNVPVATREPHLLRVTGDATYGGARPYKILYQIRAVRSDQDGVTVELDCDACLWSGAPQPVTLAQGEERTVAAVLLPPEPAQFTLRANGEACIVWTVKHSPTISGYDATCVPYVP